MLHAVVISLQTPWDSDPEPEALSINGNASEGSKGEIKEGVVEEIRPTIMESTTGFCNSPTPFEPPECTPLTPTILLRHVTRTISTPLTPRSALTLLSLEP